MFKVYGENYEKWEDIKKQYEREEPQVYTNEIPKSDFPNRPGAMRAWLNKWDPEFNTGFRQTGSQTDNTNG